VVAAAAGVPVGQIAEERGAARDLRARPGGAALHGFAPDLEQLGGEALDVGQARQRVQLVAPQRADPPWWPANRDSVSPTVWPRCVQV
jgi:hypothetical protein